jgi:hypothetical protein
MQRAVSRRQMLEEAKRRKMKKKSVLVIDKVNYEEESSPLLTREPLLEVKKIMKPVNIET